MRLERIINIRDKEKLNVITVKNSWLEEACFRVKLIIIQYNRNYR